MQLGRLMEWDGIHTLHVISFVHLVFENVLKELKAINACLWFVAHNREARLCVTKE